MFVARGVAPGFASAGGLCRSALVRAWLPSAGWATVRRDSSGVAALVLVGVCAGRRRLAVGCGASCWLIADSPSWSRAVPGLVPALLLSPSACTSDVLGRGWFRLHRGSSVGSCQRAAAGLVPRAILGLCFVRRVCCGSAPRRSGPFLGAFDCSRLGGHTRGEGGEKTVGMFVPSWLMIHRFGP